MDQPDNELNPYAAPPAGKHIPLYRRLWHASKKSWRTYRQSMREDNMSLRDQFGSFVLLGILIFFGMAGLIVAIVEGLTLR